MLREQSFTKPYCYQIHLKGVLDLKWKDWFDGIEITYTNGDSLLTGKLPDQAALHGILSKINDLGLLIISVERIDL